jgi:flagellar biosynthesis GTPase FlhF
VIFYISETKAALEEMHRQLVAELQRKHKTLLEVQQSTKFDQLMCNRKKDQERQLLEQQKIEQEKQRFAVEEQQRLAAVEQQRLAVEKQQRLAAVEQQRLAAVEQQRFAAEEQERLAVEQENQRLDSVEQQRLSRETTNNLLFGSRSLSFNEEALVNSLLSGSTPSDPDSCLLSLTDDSSNSSSSGKLS